MDLSSLNFHISLFYVAKTIREFSSITILNCKFWILNFKLQINDLCFKKVCNFSRGKSKSHFLEIWIIVERVSLNPFRLEMREFWFHDEFSDTGDRWLSNFLNIFDRWRYRWSIYGICRKVFLICHKPQKFENALQGFIHKSRNVFNKKYKRSILRYGIIGCIQAKRKRDIRSKCGVFHHVQKTLISKDIQGMKRPNPPTPMTKQKMFPLNNNEKWWQNRFLRMWLITF